MTSGGDALGDVVIQLEADGLKATGRGVATDVVEASARAYLNAVNKIVRLRERPRPARGRRGRSVTRVVRPLPGLLRKCGPVKVDDAGNR